MRSNIYIIGCLMAFVSCTFDNMRQDSVPLLLSNGLTNNAVINPCHVKQIDYIKQKIEDDALKMSASELIDRIFAIEEDFFKGIMPCGE